mgnify:CR=1 FL=1
MIQGMENIELKTNSLHMTLVRSLNKIRVEDQVLALLDLYEIAHANVERTDLLLAETLGAIGTEEVVPILVGIAKNTNIKIGVRNRAVEILGKKDPADVADTIWVPDLVSEAVTPEKLPSSIAEDIGLEDSPESPVTIVVTPPLLTQLPFDN